MYIFTIVTLLSLYYYYQHYVINKGIISKIKFGKILYISNIILAVYLIYTISFNSINVYSLWFISPLLIIGFWYSYQFYKIKNSFFDYLYLGITLLLVLVVFYSLN